MAGYKNIALPGAEVYRTYRTWRRWADWLQEQERQEPHKTRAGSGWVLRR
jgi:hypothetical protein